MESSLQKTIQTIGKPTHLINNAGIAHVGSVTDTSEEDFDLVMKVNTKGMFLCIKRVLPVMKEQGNGVILNMASIASRLGISDRFAYSASKGAVLAMTLSVAKDFVDQGIRCNCICPGRVHTPFVDGFLDKYYPEEIEKNKSLKNFQNINPLEEWEPLKEIASLATFICSEDASFITGVAYDVDGGTMTLR